MDKTKIIFIGDTSMSKRLHSVLVMAAMLGIGSGVVDAETPLPEKREPAVMPGKDERIERIIAKSKDVQERKRARRKARWSNSEARQRNR